MNDVKMGVTDYKFNYGQRIGHNPKELLNEGSVTQPIINNPLKYGTNQLWSEIPGYLGFKPSQVPFHVLKEKMEDRRKMDRGDKKLLTGQNYHTNVPGYGGYKPRVNVSQSELRSSCFDFKK